MPGEYAIAATMQGKRGEKVLTHPNAPGTRIRQAGDEHAETAKTVCRTDCMTNA